MYFKKQHSSAGPSCKIPKYEYILFLCEWNLPDSIVNQQELNKKHDKYLNSEQNVHNKQ